MAKHYTLDTILDELESQISAAGNATKWSETNDLPEAFVSRVRRGKQQPSKKLLATLGFRLITFPHQRYERIKP